MTKKSAILKDFIMQDINITAEYLQSDPEVSYVILDVESASVEDVGTRMRSIPETIRMRTLS